MKLLCFSGYDQYILTWLANDRAMIYADGHLIAVSDGRNEVMTTRIPCGATLIVYNLTYTKYTTVTQITDTSQFEIHTKITESPGTSQSETYTKVTEIPGTSQSELYTKITQFPDTSNVTYNTTNAPENTVLSEHSNFGFIGSYNIGLFTGGPNIMCTSDMSLLTKGFDLYGKYTFTVFILVHCFYSKIILLTLGF